MNKVTSDRLRVLYVDGDGPFGGASRSLYESVRSLKDWGVEPYFYLSKGTATGFYERLSRQIISVRGMPKFDHTRFGYYRGKRWLILLREFWYIPFFVVGVFRCRSRWGGIDIVHVNEIVYIVPAIILKKVFDAMLVVHVRALVFDEETLRTRVLNALLRKYADKIIAIDGNVRATLDSKHDVSIINNSFTSVSVWHESDSSALKKLSSLDRTSFKVGFVGNIHSSKGIFLVLRAALILLRENPGLNVDFIIVGGETAKHKGLFGKIVNVLGFAQNVKQELERKLDECPDVKDRFHLLGPVLDIKQVYDSLDVLLFPSYFDTPGRPVFEAGFSGVPSIIAARNPSADTFVDGVTGIAIDAGDFKALAEAILYLKENPELRKEMGLNAKMLSEQNFSPNRNAQKLLGTYRDLILRFP